MSDTQTQPPVNPALFTQIPTNILVPGNYFEVDPIYDDAGILPYPARILVIAQMLPTGSATPLKIYPLLDAQQATNLCGAGSIGEAQALQVLATKPTIPVDIICVAAAAGSTAAVGNYQWGGAWTVSGVVPIYVAGVLIQVPVGATDTPAIVAANVAAAINDAMMPTLPVNIPLPVTAAQGGSSHTTETIVTANASGIEGNNILLEFAAGPNDMPPPGLTCTITQPVGGTINPSVAAVITTIAAMTYSGIHMPWTDATNEGLLATELLNRFTAMVGQDAYAYVALFGSYGAILSAKAAMNCQFRSVAGLTAYPTPHWMVTAALCGVAEQALFNDPSLQVRGRVLPNVVGPRPANRMTWEEQQLLLSNGISTFDILQDGTVVTQRLVSENLTDVNGVATIAWRDIMAAKVATRIRYDWKGYVALTYPSNKMCNDADLAAEYDPTIATPSKLKGSWGARCNVYGKAGWIQNVQTYARLANFSLDPNDPNRMNATQPYQRMGNLMVLAGALQFEV